MIRRMLLHTALAALVVGLLGFAYQAFGRGEGAAATLAELGRAWHDGDHHGADDD